MGIVYDMVMHSKQEGSRFGPDERYVVPFAESVWSTGQCCLQLPLPAYRVPATLLLGCRSLPRTTRTSTAHVLPGSSSTVLLICSMSGSEMTGCQK
jgi:hypothetical protein